ncbi:hypothetical protein EBB07_23930 [Paenibacillaceae bacterium]|nr:hypothetical protein EBB07_23930 [Paenibacillaceae bacterium]
MNATNFKRHYYVSVSGKSIEHAPSGSDQLQILATDGEINTLQQLLKREESRDETTALKAPIPYKSADHDPAGDAYDEALIDLYRAIYKLGTSETQQHIAGMNILRELKDTDYNHPGYS